jgi:hypothetical protein
MGITSMSQPKSSSHIRASADFTSAMIPSDSNDEFEAALHPLPLFLLVIAERANAVKFLANAMDADAQSCGGLALGLATKDQCVADGAAVIRPIRAMPNHVTEQW